MVFSLKITKPMQLIGFGAALMLCGSTCTVEARAPNKNKEGGRTKKGGRSADPTPQTGGGRKAGVSQHRGRVARGSDEQESAWPPTQQMPSVSDDGQEDKASPTVAASEDRQEDEATSQQGEDNRCLLSDDEQPFPPTVEALLRANDQNGAESEEADRAAGALASAPQEKDIRGVMETLASAPQQKSWWSERMRCARRCRDSCPHRVSAALFPKEE